ncbi:cryptochrome/photolyase family protein [Candidatus Comchoanobacter bicostacola]|uniref:Cryptochrome/photolyase family protein n=1 Tax=Candidatus Comchoanobacter bicostacola TaxID=2919598 RepID=A0ABY5DKT3_9GAMM|nr:cryptochrome/photolyase family protein [Candidatus Comchoanobacter bicostacola]UTC24861.1 cryptochrome/photolyase family protein [Candidatus Comchoanobacter bicostacola]
MDHKVLHIILWDQLTQHNAALANFNKDSDHILMCESLEELTYVKHHKKKLVFLISAMRHFAQHLQDTKYPMTYIHLDDQDHLGSYSAHIQQLVGAHNFTKIKIMQPSDYFQKEMVEQWERELNIPIEQVEDNRFLCTRASFAHWASNRKQLRMEYFYREMRKRYKILMDGDQPEGGKWNYDAENRKPPKDGLLVPKPYHGVVDVITNEVMRLVEARFSDHFGDLLPFYFAVTRTQALSVLNKFIKERLSVFGDYQDAMIEGEPWMYHAHIGFYLNCGLLDPLECIKAAEKAYYSGNAPLNAVEGFIRQVLGWREYICGIYWLKMPEYKQLNYFKAKRSLPEFYWTANTKMNCLKQCVTETKQHAYAHHIQRLMVLGNFALIAGINPDEVNEWYHIVYADAHEWVELPNVSGMVLFADGGYLASKPYAAGGSYINKMSNYCKGCTYSPTKKNGEGACPFNYLYWDFLVRNREKLADNHRIGMMYRTYDRMDDEKKEAIAQDSIKFLKGIE